MMTCAAVTPAALCHICVCLTVFVCVRGCACACVATSTADIVMALSWGLSCGTSYYLPFFYVSFFTTFLLTRESRDVRRCQAKYGKDWDTYMRQVPYAFIPGIF